MRAPAHLSARDRRLWLAARSICRWQAGPALLWPPTAMTLKEADRDWLVEVLAHVFEAVAIAAALEATELVA